MSRSASEVSAGRQIVVLADGTNNNLTGRLDDTNVVKLAELLAADPRDDEQRLVFYDPGVGNPGELPGATRVDQIKRHVDRLSGLAFGRGVYENIADCYLFLMHHWREGDQLWIFGFSRGAFTARSLAGIVNRFGILEPQHANMVPTLLHIYFSAKPDAADDGSTPEQVWDRIVQQARHLFARPALRKVEIHFIGVWDTVAAVGLGPFGLRFTQLPKPEGKHFLHIRQALALDEHRLQFLPRLYAGQNGPFENRLGHTGSLVQLWFPGAHCDVGGGYARGMSACSDTALAWLVGQAVQMGLKLDHHGLPLASEAEVVQALSALELRPVPGPEPALHSQLQMTPVYALTGMAVRDTTRVVMDNGETFELVAEAHASAPPNSAPLPGAWADAKAPGWAWKCLLAAALLSVVMGQLHAGFPDTGSWWRDLSVAATQIPHYLSKNLEFQAWQLTGWLNWTWLEGRPADLSSIGAWLNADWADEFRRFRHPIAATAVDLLFIAAYAAGLCWFAARAFGRRAGVRKAGDGDDAALNLQGRALLGLVVFDLAEDVATILAFVLAMLGASVLAFLAQLLVAWLSVQKLLRMWRLVRLLSSAAARR
ncbi:MAG: DUF2235 domain-containing protein [Rubrivivax sp.]|nr:DUF2235 domain-containing protein [Rubrivivax sp.]